MFIFLIDVKLNNDIINNRGLNKKKSALKILYLKKLHLMN